MEKLWQGALHGAPDASAEAFNSSIATDSRLYAEDIRGSAAHAAMLGAQGIIPAEDAAAIIAGLEAILADIESGALAIDPASEDIHTFIETELTRRTGSAGKRLHTARSRNDQVALDLKMYVRRELQATAELVKTLKDALHAKAKEHAHTVMPGYTHLQRAQPVTFGTYLSAYSAMLSRDLTRLEDAGKRLNLSPLGAGALAGVTYPIDRAMTASALGFDGVAENTLDAVSDRDFAAEAAFACSLIMMHLSRLAEELVLWSSWEFRFIELSDAFTTGSSIMPQKKNPDIAELVRGKTGRVYGDLVTLLTLLKGLPLAYNKDMQEDKDAVFDALDTVKACLTVTAPMIATMRVNADNMRRAAAKGFINATDCADYLTSRGVPFRDAYRVTGDIVAYCTEKNKTLETLSLEEYGNFSSVFAVDIYDAVSLDECVRKRNM